MKYFIILKNATAASGAVKLLKRKGFRVRQGRISDKNGCRFGLYTDNGTDKICDILRTNNFVCIGIKRIGERR